MNKVILVGRLTKNPDIRYSSGDNQFCIARYTLAVDRKKKGETDFITCKALGRAGEFAGRYFKKGMRVSVSGRIETGSYTNQKGERVYTTDVLIEDQEFAQSRSEGNPAVEDQQFNDVNQEELPFN